MFIKCVQLLGGRIFSRHSYFLTQYNKIFSFKIKHYCNKTDYIFPLRELDFDYICDPANTNAIRENIKNRKGIGSIDKVLELKEKIENLKQKRDLDDTDRKLFEQLQDEFFYEANNIPNVTHPDVLKTLDEPTELEIFGEKAKFDFEPIQFHLNAKELCVLRMDFLGHFSNDRSYQFKGPLAKLERALINYCVECLVRKGFDLVSVPDILHPEILERCGMITAGNPHTQIYCIKPSPIGDASFAGTAEMALAAYFIDSKLSHEDLPQKKVAVSRCFRAEIGRGKSEKGIYRVHQFNKVEMFGVTANETKSESEELLNELLSIQKEFLSEFGLHYKVLDMPSADLAAAAYRKYDIEAWMPGRGLYGEVTSASNCTDYQSRRLGIKYYSKDKNLKFAHTVNGTACAIPRLIISIFETYQNKDGSVTIPEVLRPYMDGLDKIEKNESSRIMYYMITEKRLKRI